MKWQLGVLTLFFGLMVMPDEAAAWAASLTKGLAAGAKP